MNTENVVKNLRVLWRTDRIIADIRMRHLLVSLGLRAFCGGDRSIRPADAGAVGLFRAGPDLERHFRRGHSWRAHLRDCSDLVCNRGEAAVPVVSLSSPMKFMLPRSTRCSSRRERCNPSCLE